LARLVHAIDPRPTDRAIEVATGPGYVAMALAEHCGEVVGIDLTPAPIAIAERISRERGLINVRFQIGEASHLPFGDGQFDLAVCRFALHHFEHPEAILAEMCRVCRRGGTVAIEDLFASETPERAAYYNHVEQLRDGSHTRALGLSELIAMTARSGLELERIHSDRLTADVEEWLAGAQTPTDKAIEVRRLLDDDLRNDLSGMRTFIRDGALCFIQRMAALVCRKR
jgi:SAM-dependent methyltransferase